MMNNGDADDHPTSIEAPEESDALATPKLGVFYGIDGAGLDALTAGTATQPVPNRLVNDPATVRYILSNSGGSSPAFVTAVHAKGAAFKYALAFDEPRPNADFVAAPQSQLDSWARATRDRIAAIGADHWAYNEIHSTAPSQAPYRAQLARMFRALYQPAGSTHPPMRGVIFSIGSNVRDHTNWTGAGIPDFWHAVDDTAVAFVLEQYKTASWVAANTEAYIGRSMFDLRAWLADHSDPKLRSVALNRFTVMISPYYGSPIRSTAACGWAMNWAGADAHDATALPIVRGTYLLIHPGSCRGSGYLIPTICWSSGRAA